MRCVAAGYGWSFTSLFHIMHIFQYKGRAGTTSSSTISSSTMTLGNQAIQSYMYIKERDSMANPVVAVVNDDTQFLRLMELVLSDAGYETLMFYEAGEAYQSIKKHLPDLVVLDIRMEHPEAGWTILELMRLDRETADIPVLICSADYEALDAKEEYLQSKRVGLLRKPFDIEDLVARVREYVGPPHGRQVNSGAGSSSLADA
jgi:CheY-like chemotaxis protein